MYFSLYVTFDSGMDNNEPDTEFCSRFKRVLLNESLEELTVPAIWIPEISSDGNFAVNSGSGITYRVILNGELLSKYSTCPL